MVVNHQVAIQPTPVLWWCYKHAVPVYSSVVNSSLFNEKSTPLFSSRLLWVKLISLYYVVYISYLFHNSASKALELGHGSINSILIAEVVVVRSDQQRQGIMLSAVPALLSSLQCQQGHGISKAKGAQGLLRTSTLVAQHSQRTQSLKSALCVLPMAHEKEKKASLDFLVRNPNEANSSNMHYVRKI